MAMIAGVILAAGASTRMGRTKALLPLEGETFLSRIVATFERAGIEEIVVVIGHDAASIRSAHERLRARFVENAEWERGQLSSLLAGIDVVDRPGVQAALVTLVDVPLVAPATVASVVDCYRRSHAPLVRPVSRGRHGHPVLFDRSLFDELRHADPASGAKSVVRRHASEAGDVEVEDEGAFADADTPAEYARLTGVNADRR